MPARIESIDTLRGIAICAVVAVHSAQHFPSGINLLDTLAFQGRFGVQLFFIISAITMCLVWDRSRKDRHQLLNFYVRRLTRIAPLFWIALVLYFPAMPNTLYEAMLASTLTQGVEAYQTNQSVPGGCSIAVEVMFYAIFPLIVSLRLPSNLKLGLAFISWLAMELVLRDILNHTLFHHLDETTKNEAIYFSFVTQLPVFLVGMYCYQKIFHGERISLGEYLMAACWLLSSWWITTTTGNSPKFFPFVIFALGTATLAITKLHLKHKILVSLGQQSYGIYLIHFAVLGTLDQILTIDKSVVSILTAFGLTIALSHLTATFADRIFGKPIQTHARKLLEKH